MKLYKTIGVVGGMGPETTVSFYARLIKLFQTEKGALHNHDFPEMLIHNVPSTDNVEEGVGPELWPFLRDSCRLLERTGVDFIVIPCNSVHVYIEEARAAVSIPILSILEETTARIVAAGCKNVLLLATWSTVKFGLYSNPLEKRGICVTVPQPDLQQKITDLIMRVCSNRVTSADREQLKAIIRAYPEVDAVILGCTELPLLMDPLPRELRVFDTLAILARSTFAFAVEPKNTAEHGRGDGRLRAPLPPGAEPE